MSELITIPSSQVLSSLPLPQPRVAISIRVATIDDLPFIDGLQKKTSKMVGFMPTKQLEGKIAAGEVLVAESDEATKRRSDEGEEKNASASSPSVASSLRRSVAIRVGYLIGCDRYFKRDDVGIIYAINVVPEYRRSLVAASLLKAQFERSAYGCKLYCCWCAQDIEANRFWESMGFVPLAYRCGGRHGGTKARRHEGEDKGDSSLRASVPPCLRASSPRIHIFWQKRIRAGDTSTPWWFPSKTTGGSIREDRIVLPIPPGTHWSDAKPLILPGAAAMGATGCTQPVKSRGAANAHGLSTTRGTRTKAKKAIEQPKVVPMGNGLLFAIPQPGEALTMPAKAKPTKEKIVREKRKSDPRLVAAARELRDRWLEHVNGEGTLPSAAKYELAVALPGRTTLIDAATTLPLLAA